MNWSRDELMDFGMRTAQQYLSQNPGDTNNDSLRQCLVENLRNEDMTPEQVKAAVIFTNKAVFSLLYNNMTDKAFAFPVANPEQVLSDLSNPIVPTVDGHPTQTLKPTEDDANYDRNIPSGMTVPMMSRNAEKLDKVASLGLQKTLPYFDLTETGAVPNLPKLGELAVFFKNAADESDMANLNKKQAIKELATVLRQLLSRGVPPEKLQAIVQQQSPYSQRPSELLQFFGEALKQAMSTMPKSAPNTESQETPLVPDDGSQNVAIKEAMDATMSKYAQYLNYINSDEKAQKEMMALRETMVKIASLSPEAATFLKHELEAME